MSDKKGGKGRDWGYASYDVDRYDDTSDSNLQYTSYEKSGSVNRYADNGDGGHSHEHWNSSDDYNNGSDHDEGRSESNDTPNPSIGEVQDNGGCYLTGACMRHMMETFDDNCEELTILRWFRDNYVSDEDVDHYYRTAPVIVEVIDSLDNSFDVYNSIYEHVVKPCVAAIKRCDYSFAYHRYRSSILDLEEKYASYMLQSRLHRTLKPANN